MQWRKGGGWAQTVYSLKNACKNLKKVWLTPLQINISAVMQVDILNKMFHVKPQVQTGCHLSFFLLFPMLISSVCGPSLVSGVNMTTVTTCKQAEKIFQWSCSRDLFVPSWKLKRPSVMIIDIFHKTFHLVYLFKKKQTNIEGDLSWIHLEM